MKEIFISWTEEVEYNLTVEVPNNFDVDDFAGAGEILHTLALAGKLVPDEEHGGSRVIQGVEEVE